MGFRVWGFWFGVKGVQHQLVLGNCPRAGLVVDDTSASERASGFRG